MTEGVCTGVTDGASVRATARDGIAGGARQLLVGSIRRPAVAWAEELTGVQAMAARIACEQMTAPAMKLLLDSVERASSLPSKPGWERKAVPLMLHRGQR